MTALKQLTCLRCDYQWWPKSPEKPKRCASCNSPYWFRKRGKVKVGRPKKLIDTAPTKTAKGKER